MDAVFKRYFWLLNIVVVVLGGFIVSRALLAYAEYDLLSVPWVESMGGLAQKREGDEGEFLRIAGNRSVDLERRRELVRPAKPAEAPVAKVEEAPPIEPQEEFIPEESNRQETDIHMDVMGIVQADESSLSMVLAMVDGQLRWLKKGTVVKPGFTVTEISKDYLVINDSLYKELWGAKVPPEPPGPPKLASMGPPMSPTRPSLADRQPNVRTTTYSVDAAPPEGSKYAAGVKQTGAWEYSIDRNMLNEQLQNLGELGREARVVPNYDRDAGSYKGFKLIGVRPDSLYRAIGIRSGDVIVRVNGDELTNPAKALELFNQLQTSSNITLDIQRRGQTHSLTYKIE